MSTVSQTSLEYKRLLFGVPEGFNARAVLPPRLWYRVDEANFLISTIVKKMYFGKTDREGFARLNRRVLERVVPKRSLSAIIDALLDADIVERDACYRIGQFSVGYRLATAWRTRPIHWTPAADPRLIERVRRELVFLESLRLARRLPIHDDLDRVQRVLLTVAPAAYDVAASFEDTAVRRRQQTLLSQISRARPGRRSFTGRYFSAFCGCKKVLRPYFRLAGEPLAGVDCCCCQPALLAALLGPQLTRNAQCGGTYTSHIVAARACPSADVCRGLSLGRDSAGVLSLEYIASVAAGAPTCGRDLGRFTDLTDSANFYEYMYDRARSAGVDLSGAGSELSAVKKLTLQEVVAKHGAYPSDFERVFSEAFPTVHRAVRWINSSRSPADGCGRENVHGKLVRILQRLESAVIIEAACPALLADGVPIVPLHDCLYSRCSDVAAVEEKLCDVFGRCGLRMSVKREIFSGQVLAV